MRRILVAALAVCLLLLPHAALCRDLLVATFDNPPLEFYDDDSARGVNVDIARECLQRMGYGMIVIFVPWSRALKMVRTGEVDAILDAGWTAERSKYLHFSDEGIYREEIFAFKLRERALTLSAGFEGAGKYLVGVGRGTSYGLEVDKAILSGRLVVESVTEIDNNIQKLLRGRIDMFFADRLGAEHALQRMGLTGSIHIVRQAGSNMEYSLGFSTTYMAFSSRAFDPEIARRFSMVLRGLKADGTVQRIADSYN